MSRRIPARRRRSVRTPLVVALGLCAVVAGVVTFLVQQSPSSVSTSTVTAYQDAIRSAIQHWGQIEVLGMRPAMVDLRNGTGPGSDAIGGEARAWQRGLHEIDGQLAKVPASGALSVVTQQFRQALALYLTAATRVEAAAADAVQRDALIDAAVRSAMQGDCVYDDASVHLQQARTAAGLGITDEFPNAPCAGAAGSTSRP